MDLKDVATEYRSTPLKMASAVRSLRRRYNLPISCKRLEKGHVYYVPPAWLREYVETPPLRSGLLEELRDLVIFAKQQQFTVGPTVLAFGKLLAKGESDDDFDRDNG